MSSYFLFIITFLSAQISYGQRLIYDDKIPVEKLRVVLEQTQGGKVSDMLTDLEYIPLQGGKNNLVNYIADIVIHDNKIGLVTSNEGYFYLYNADGSFLKKITKIDGFKSPYGEKALFYEVKKDSAGFILEHGAFRARVDLMGNLVDTLTRSDQNVKDDGFGQYVQDEIRIGDAKYKCYGIYQSEKRKKQDVLLYNDSVILKYNVLDTIKQFLTVNHISKVHNDKAYLTAGYNTKIFELDSAGIAKIYDLVLPLRNTFDLEKAKAAGLGSDDFMKTYNYLDQSNNVVYGLNNVFPYKDYLIFKAQRFHKPMWLVYNLKTKQTYGLDNILPDASNDYLNFFDVNELFVDGDYLYSFIFPHHVLAAKDKSKLEGHTMHKEYADLGRYNNPILVRFKLK
ncbi:6-bladed beta-propeller [Sphingobacterium bovistauri]|uniref:6-bladed beta-propeller n=1 Tax=Sphingobacterium bovistauri TaxID=2781959 RepID=A0ABS7Z282_9SPHI|nr:6-bladed beta-propeller [Sphingobacterium bovistauri]MCA5004294.1 6-bladed beta-propeller [Sphingobacterium bovistauri]